MTEGRTPIPPRDSVFSFADWLAYLRDKAISNTFIGRPVLAGVDWRLKP